MNSELEGQCRAITTSSGVLQQDVGEVQAKHKDPEKRIRELEAEPEVERRSRLEWGKTRIGAEGRERWLEGSASLWRC